MSVRKVPFNPAASASHSAPNAARPGAPLEPRSIPAGLYIHTPFCETKCGYCDFYSVALKGRQTAPLVAALIAELERRLASCPHPIRTIFIGGGTPTLLPYDDLARLLAKVSDLVGCLNARHQLRQSPAAHEGRSRLCRSPGHDAEPLDPAAAIEEFTVEANPATVDEAKAELLARSGATRVSMGAQSFFPSELATLERLHSPDDIAPSVEILRRAGISQINLDLIFGIPGQTLDTWSQSLRRAIELGPDHVACYGLTFEPNTRLTAQRQAGRITPCDEDLEAEMFLRTIDILESAGFRQYEISNYAKPGRECRHNLIYWKNEPYIGIGPSAAGCYDHLSVSPNSGPPAGPPREYSRQGTGKDIRSGPASGESRTWLPRRYKNVADIAHYVRMIRDTGTAEIESEIIAGEALIHEMILMQLRLNEGLSLQAFRDRTGLDPVAVFGETLDRLVNDGWVTLSPAHLALSRAGRLIANRIMTELAAACAIPQP